MLNADDCRQLKSILDNAGCCPRCILRHFGERTYTIYAETKSVLSEIAQRCTGAHVSNLQGDSNETHDQLTSKEATTDSFPPPKRKHLSTCTCCLNILQSGCNSSTINMIISTVIESSHQFRSFVLQLSTPPSVELRQMLMDLHLKQENSDLHAKCSELDIPSIRDAWKWSVGPSVASYFKADCISRSSFSISVKMSHPDLEKECKPLQSFGDFPNGKSKNIEEIYSRSSVSRAIQKHQNALKLIYPLPPEEPSSEVTVDLVTCSHQPVYLAGRYNKFSREVSQTPWVVDGEKKLTSSVEERISSVVLKHVEAERIVFSSSGREDVDVRMLGSGRPFVLELINPKTVLLSKETMKTLQDAINNSTKDIAVKDFQVVNKDDLQNLKEGEEEKRKSYCALCCINRPLMQADLEKVAGVTNLEIMQKTPIRVLHRRTQAIRKRIIFSMALEKKNESTFLLHLDTQAGTYVKEFVHGDFGRTKPSLRDILKAKTDIMELDVERVELDWPPPTE